MKNNEKCTLMTFLLMKISELFKYTIIDYFLY